VINMSFKKYWRRLGVVLAGLGATLAAFAAGAPASMASGNHTFGSGMLPPPAETAVPPAVVRTVVVGGMPGWQIALIAAAAALVVAVAAVLADRARSARRRLVTDPA
jgi:hypothetical protein